MIRTLGTALFAVALALVGPDSVCAQLPTEPRELIAALLAAKNPPADINEEQRALLDKAVLALRESKTSWSEEVNAAFAEFATTYFVGKQDPKLTPWVLHVVNLALVDEEASEEMSELLKYDLQQKYQDYAQGMQVLSGILKEADEAIKQILSNMKG